ncbi:hypothetical protein ACFV4P_01630 [Kitasatospora sp. NPDC059795]|uniref:hypothetical protein n=1 Tax=Kitasatospora sp. NPDC059795 TaxID=3346949 RepID=UPI0036478B76
MTTSQQRLHHTLDALDTAARRAERPGPPVRGCEHCWDPEDFALLSGPAALVPDRLLHRAAAKSTDLWEDFPALYRRLAPRILRQLTTGRMRVDGPLIASRLLAADWRAWPHADRVVDVLDAWWSAALDRPDPLPDVAEVLETTATATGSLTRWLRTWEATRTATADHHLTDALEGWLRWGELPGLTFGFYDELPVGAELTRWLLALPPGRIGADQRYWLELLDSPSPSTP